MKISRKYVPALTVLFIGVGVGLALLLALFIGVGTARAGEPYCWEEGYCCSQQWIAPGETAWCWGWIVKDIWGCETIAIYYAGGEDVSVWCLEETGGDIWLADVCEPNDGFSDNGEMTWDSDHAGPLQVAAAMEGPWFELQVNGPPWVVTEEMMNAFAGMVGLDDWHEMWISSGTGTPQHVGNAVMEREGHMDALCNP